MNCETCAYFVFDEDYEEYICSADMDEDDYARLMQDGSRKCPFWWNGDEM